LSRTDPRGILLAAALLAGSFAAAPAIAQDGYTIIGPDADTATIQRSLKGSLQARERTPVGGTSRSLSTSPAPTFRSLSAQPNEAPEYLEPAPNPVGFLVTFNFDSAVPTAEGAYLLQLITQSIVTDPQLASAAYVIDGHTDSTGSAPYNHTLGAQRAQTVVNTLIAAGISPTRITARSFGETSGIPGLPGPDPRNRRVEISPFLYQ